MRRKVIEVIPQCLLFTFLLAGVFSYRDYGISWDEDFQYTKNGHAVWDYIQGGERDVYETNPERYHGPAFELALVAVEKISGVEGKKEIFFQRHMLTFLLFWISGIALFLLLKQKFSSTILIALGICWYFLMPRIYADAFYNSKDIPVLALTTISLLSMQLLLKKNLWQYAAIHGVICGFLIAIRLTGIIIPAVTTLMLIYSIWISGNEVRKIAGNIFIFLLVCMVTMFACWPILWEMPWYHLMAAWEEMSRFPFNKEVLFRGQFIPAPMLPWDYTITWIGISTPLLYLVLMIAGIYFACKKLISDLSTKQLPQEFILVAIALLPIIAIWLFDAVVYDAWRHLFYIYAPLCLLMTSGLSQLLASLKTQQSRYLILSTAMICTLFIGYQMLKMHPYQNVYFNQLAGVDVRSEYEMDYWGLSYREALEKLAKSSNATVIKIAVENIPGVLNSWILDENTKSRFTFVNEIDSANYFITNYRWRMHNEPHYPMVDSIIVNGERISGTYKID